MSIKDIIRAWKDSSYRESLSEEQLAQLPANPVGDVLSEEELQVVTGGMKNTCATDVDVCSCSGEAGCINTELCRWTASWGC
jgi:mersacidin/lichenicidin family type 2 lantibiotic